jgi:hypothetical protein
LPVTEVTVIGSVNVPAMVLSVNAPPTPVASIAARIEATATQKAPLLSLRAGPICPMLTC